MSERTETEALADLALRSAATPQIIEADDGRRFLVIPDAATEREVTDPLGLVSDPLRFVRQAVTLQTIHSLVDYVNRFRTPDTVLFADIAASRITAVLDYHTPPAPAGSDGEMAIEDVAIARATAHRATMALPFSEEWKLWSGISGKLMPQEEFARFVEENAPDVTSPSGAELLEVARDLQAVRKADFRKVVRTNGDAESFEYTEETDARTRNGSVEVPTRFQLHIPVYFGSRSVELYAFLRWKLSEGHLLMGIQLNRAEHVRQAMFREIVDDAAALTEQPVVYGFLEGALDSGLGVPAQLLKSGPR